MNKFTTAINDLKNEMLVIVKKPVDAEGLPEEPEDLDTFSTGVKDIFNKLGLTPCIDDNTDTVSPSCGLLKPCDDKLFGHDTEIKDDDAEKEEKEKKEKEDEGDETSKSELKLTRNPDGSVSMEFDTATINLTPDAVDILKTFLVGENVDKESSEDDDELTTDIDDEDDKNDESTKKED